MDESADASVGVVIGWSVDTVLATYLVDIFVLLY